MRRKSAALSLSLIYTALIIYASLFPFTGWRYQGIPPWAFLTAPFPRYWSGFDVVINIAGYIPFGSLLALSALRSGYARHAIWVPCVVAMLFSFSMEMLQSYLPTRIPSREDWLLNSCGATVGAVTTILLAGRGMIVRWSAWRSRWFVDHAHGGLVLLALWPIALLFPPPVPFGLGHVLDRLEDVLAVWLVDTPFIDWLPLHSSFLDQEPMNPGTQVICVALGLLLPCLLAYCIIPSWIKRMVFALLLMAAGVAMTVLSSILSWGPAHAWSWVDLPAQFGMVLAVVLAMMMALTPSGISTPLLLLLMGVYLSMVNQAPANPYLAQTLQAWEQGRFIRFHGLAQWLGWLWPYAALFFVVSLQWQRDSGHLGVVEKIESPHDIN
jgi:VanZ family protein